MLFAGLAREVGNAPSPAGGSRRLRRLPGPFGGGGGPSWRNYAMGLVFGLGAMAVRLGSSPIVGEGRALPTFFLGVAAAACLGGVGPAIATLGVMLAASPWFPSPPGSEAAVGGATAMGLGLYALSGGGVAYVGGRVRRSLARCELARQVAGLQADERLRAARVEEERLLREQVDLRETAEGQSRRLEDLLREVREKNAFLTAILRQVPAGLLVAESGTARILLCNDEAGRISRGSIRPGLPVDLEGADGLIGRRSDGSTYGPDDWPLARTLRDGEAVADEEIELEFSDGERRRVSVSSGPAVDESGRPIAAVAALLDVTARRAAEDGLVDSERRFRQLAEAVTQVVYITRPDDSIAFLNGRWFDYTGASRDHVEVKDAWLAAIHPDDVPVVLGARARSKEAGGATEIEYRIRGRDGSYRWFLGRSIWVRDESGALTSRIGTATDIDDQKRAERAARFLADAGARLAALTDAETALREVARLAVPAFADWCAVDVMDARGGLRRVVAAHDERDPAWVVETISHRYRLRPDMPQGIFEVLATRRPSLVSDLTDDHLRAAARNEEHLTALRAFAPRSYMCIPLVGREGVLGALSFATTRSGRRYDRDDLGLAVDLGARAAVALENARLYDRLREADRRKDDFLATLAHELRNPMAPISNAVSILRFKGSADPDSRWAHDVIDRQVSHLVRLVDDLLDVSRITRDKLELRPDRMDLALAVADAVEIARPAVDAREQDLRIDIAPGPIPMVADRTRLAQAIANLLDNASKFSDRGAAIDLHVAREGDRADVRVTDRGAGIAADQLPRVFDMFAQFAPVLERSQGGLGIGLALARGLVELHGGTIEAMSPGPGRGSTFVVRLPLDAGVADARPSPATQPQPGVDETARARVLVVDDSEDIAESLGRLLSLHGCEVHLAFDGETAFRMAGSIRPDFAVLDIGLPGMNGYQVAEAIRNEPWGRDIILIAVTGWGRANDRRRSAEAGFDHHLVKPVEASALAEIIADPTSTYP
ncbi:MAG: hypothetical protein BGO49_14030 [Planctomycetales bacterium 71-10]|nr:MAG: hypothetical protein BGO49_14030 [Planctomycetales bacterium 71-10]